MSTAPAEGTVRPDDAATRAERPATTWRVGTLDLASVAIQVVYLLGLAALAAGVYVLRDTQIGADVATALAAVAEHLPVTGAAAGLVLAAAALNVACGAVLLRAVRGVPFAGLGAAILGGLAGAVLLDTALMAVLGLLGLFRWPVLLALNGLLLVFGVRLRPFFTPGQALIQRPALGPFGWLLLAAVWSGPVLLALASPVVPFNDVPPNHVAPVEHLRTFGSLSALDMTFSPIYGPSRIFLGYQATVGVVATLADVPGAAAVGAFAITLAFLVALAGHALAVAIGGPRAGTWALFLVPLSVTFLRLPDARAGVLAFPLAALALLMAVQPASGRSPRRAVALALVLAATTFVHPLMGLCASAAVGLWAIASRRAGSADAVAAAVAAPVIAAPQWAAMLGLDWASATALVALPAAGGLLYALTSPPARRLLRTTLPIALAAIAVALAALGAWFMGWITPEYVLAGAPALLVDYSVLLIGAAIGLAGAIVRRMTGFEVLVAGVVAGLLVASMGLAAADIGSLGAAFAYEVPKAVTYFAPTLLAIGAAVGLAALWSAAGQSRRRTMLAAAVSAVLLIAAAAPIRPGVVDALSLGEHRLSESLSISLRTAANGYWQGYPDERYLVDDEQRELIEALRAEVAAGRLADAANVLHVARTWRSDVSPSYTTPLGVFAGVVETTATTDPENSIHTAGGRLRDIAELDAMLGPEFPYVVVEGGGLPPAMVSRILAAGYVRVFGNAKAQVFARRG